MDMGGWSLDQLMELAGLSVSQAGQFYLPETETTDDSNNWL
jgi:NAD(P)H-hydrate repair Nnr-like enzyme with NAD(P)H-hydrate epimerase domain